MIERDTAIRIVEEELELTYQRELSAGLDPQRMAVAHVEEHELAWIVSYQSEEWLRTRDLRSSLVGNGPYLVDRIDGGLHRIGSARPAADGAWEDDYRVRVRGGVIRAVEDLHHEVRAAAEARGRIHAIHVLRHRVPALNLTQGIEYVRALKNGDAPAHLVEISTAELISPTNPATSVRTIRKAEHPRAN